jgi:FkbM family methyltransferase
MEIKYGIPDRSIDITEICYSKLCKNNIIYIPENDYTRAKIFGDPLYDIKKSIFIENDLGEINEYDTSKNIYINTITNDIIIDYNINETKKLTEIHNKLQLHFGSFNDEYPEQLMAVKYITGDEKVLEIGANIGRNSLVIASILNAKNNNNLVTLETSKQSVEQLTYNKNVNNLIFHIEPSALSNNRLIQRDWDTIESNEVLDGYFEVNTIKLAELYNKYNIYFDTLVLDCEGAFYNILRDMPEILDNVKLIIMENDYHEIYKKQFVDDVLMKNGFYVTYSREGGWGPCYNNFFEVWKK